MTLHWADLAVMLALVVAGVVVSYLLVLRKLRKAISDSHREMERRLNALTEAITMQTTSPVEPAPSTDALAAEEIETELIAEGAKWPRARESEPVPPEIQAAIAAAAIALLGRNARIHDARVATARNAVSPWTQQGRVLVQASHNFRTRT